MSSNHYTQNSPQLSTAGMAMYGMPMGRANSGRAPSFDEPSMLPPSALGDGQDPSNPNYSPYSQASSNAGNLFQPQQPWGYGGLPEMYPNAQVSPLQPRPTHHIPMGYPMAPPMRPMGPYGAYYPACSPGPPIQTTASNKGYVMCSSYSNRRCPNLTAFVVSFQSPRKQPLCLSHSK